MRAWENWFHCTAHTYGTWLRGDPRGWRSRDHREHVDGDYKNPPPRGKYDDLHEHSKSLMKRDPVRIQTDLRQFVVDKVVKRLVERYNPCEIASFDAIHLHVLVQCNNPSPRVELGAAKQYATAQLKAHGFAMGLQLGEGIWGKGSHPEPIADRAHGLRVCKYIRDHAQGGASLWTTERLAILFPPSLAR